MIRRFADLAMLNFASGLVLSSLPTHCYAFITYSAEPIEAWVVDEETGKPLEDVVVLAHWQLRSTWIEPQIIGELTILDTKTDSNGRFAGKKLRMEGDAEYDCVVFHETAQLRAKGVRADALPSGFRNEDRCGSAQAWVDGLPK